MLELKNIMTELKSLIQSFKSRLKHAEEKIIDLQGETFQIIESEEQKENKKN